MSDHLADTIRLRIEAGESVSQIARSADVYRTTVTRFLAGRTIFDSTRAKLAQSRPQTEAERDTIRHAAAQAGARGRHMIRTTVEEFEAMLATPKGKELVARLHRQQAEWDAAQEAAKTNERTPPTGG